MASLERTRRQRLAAGFDRHHGSAQQLHAEDVGALALDVLVPM